MTAAAADREHLYDWVIVQRVITGRGRVPRPLCFRELKEVTEYFAEHGHTADYIARRCHVHPRQILPHLPPDPTTTAPGGP